jgi:hypothetical protein
MPGVPDGGGIRFEDEVLITEKDCEVLTHAVAEAARDLVFGQSDLSIGRCRRLPVIAAASTWLSGAAADREPTREPC